MKRIAIICTHPVQYYVPFFKLLNDSTEVILKVFYTWGEGCIKKYDPGFGKFIEWDIPLLEGYDHEMIANQAREPGSHHFWGIRNRDLIRHVGLFSPDIIWVYGWAYYSHLELMRYYKGKIPIWFRGDSTLRDEQGLKNILRRSILKWVYLHADKAFFAGSENKKYFLRHGLKEQQLVFFPHATDNSRFGTCYKEAAMELRKTLHVGPHEILVLFAGKLESKKDPLLLLEVFASLTGVKVHLLFAGNGPLESLLKQKASGSGNIHFRDFINQRSIPAYYQAADLFCLPSKGPGESWGLAVNEAMACGKAVLVSRAAGCSADLVNEGYNGYTFQPGDGADLACKLSHLLHKSRIELEIMGKFSAKLIHHFSFEAQLRAVENEINRFAGSSVKRLVHEKKISS